MSTTITLPNKCRQCGGPITVPAARRGRRPQYCSARCRRAWRTADQKDARAHARDVAKPPEPHEVPPEVAAAVAGRRARYAALLINPAYREFPDIDWGEPIPVAAYGSLWTADTFAAEASAATLIDADGQLAMVPAPTTDGGEDAKREGRSNWTPRDIHPGRDIAAEWVAQTYGMKLPEPNTKHGRTAK